MEQHEIAYALSKQVPCIKDCAWFETNYGSLRVYGEDAKQIAAVVRDILEKKLEAARCRPVTTCAAQKA